MYLLCIQISPNNGLQYAVGNVENDNILHICAKRCVPIYLFKMILNSLSHTKRKDSEGNLPLHLVAGTKKDNLHICKELLKASKEIYTSYNSSSDKSVRQNSLILEILSIQNRAGNTAAHVASAQGHEQILKLMWEAMSRKERANREKGLFMTDHNRFTCLHLAVMNGDDAGKQFYT
jgi:ankyrin repeat protein